MNKKTSEINMYHKFITLINFEVRSNYYNTYKKLSNSNPILQMLNGGTEIGDILIRYLYIDFSIIYEILNNIKKGSNIKFIEKFKEELIEAFSNPIGELLCNEYIGLYCNFIENTDYLEDLYEKIDIYEEYLELCNKIPNAKLDIRKAFKIICYYLEKIQFDYKNLIKKYPAKSFIKNINDRIVEMNLIYKVTNISTNHINTVFKTSDLNSFVLFDICKIVEKQLNINQCKNCKKYFITSSKITKEWCNKPYINDKTCTQLRFNKKEICELYRKTYKTYHARKQRNKHNSNIGKRFDNWVRLAQKQKEDCKNGLQSPKEFKQWIIDNDNWHIDSKFN